MAKSGHRRRTDLPSGRMDLPLGGFGRNGTHRLVGMVIARSVSEKTTEDGKCGPRHFCAGIARVTAPDITVFRQSKGPLAPRFPL